MLLYGQQRISTHRHTDSQQTPIHPCSPQPKLTSIKLTNTTITPTKKMMKQKSRSTSHADTSGPPAESISVVNINRDEVNLHEHRSTFNDGPSPNPPGRLGPDVVSLKSSGNHLNTKSSKKRLKRKKRKQQEKAKKGQKERSRRCTMRLATWNVRTMTPGIADTIAGIKDARKTAVIDKELTRLNIDIAALQETRLADSGTLREKNYTFFWQGKRDDQKREHGVGFAVNNKLLKMISEPTEGTERLLIMPLTQARGQLT